VERLTLSVQRVARDQGEGRRDYERPGYREVIRRISVAASGTCSAVPAANTKNLPRLQDRGFKEVPLYHIYHTGGGLFGIVRMPSRRRLMR
jgi:hypothetical protein